MKPEAKLIVPAPPFAVKTRSPVLETETKPGPLPAAIRLIARPLPVFITSTLCEPGPWPITATLPLDERLMPATLRPTLIVRRTRLALASITLTDLPVELVTKAREPSRLTATSKGPLPTLSVRVVVRVPRSTTATEPAPAVT